MEDLAFAARLSSRPEMARTAVARFAASASPDYISGAHEAALEV
jgi:hypothetical protein